jgi:hypothetical protein
MSQFRQRPLPVVAVSCLVIFLAYTILTTSSQTLHCRQALAAAQCEAIQSVLFGQLPYATTDFQVDSVEVRSELTDRTPRGGVRFHHVLVLQSDRGSFTADLNQSPLAGVVIQKQVQDFLAGSGPHELIFGPAVAPFALARVALMALLLSVMTWGFWDLRWPAGRAASTIPPEEQV